MLALELEQNVCQLNDTILHPHRADKDETRLT
jgi:hypothetical protein